MPTCEYGQLCMYCDFRDILGLGPAFRRSQKCVSVLKCHLQGRFAPKPPPGALPLDLRRGEPRTPIGSRARHILGSKPTLLFSCAATVCRHYSDTITSNTFNS